MLEIKKLLNYEKEEALLFVKKVYLESKDDSYTEEGIKTFENFLNNKKIIKSFKFYGAFENNILKGVIVTDKAGRHINLFFVDKYSQGRGIGRKLMNFILENNKNFYITVNSSRYGVIIYEKLGFVKIDDEKKQDGLIFTPMKKVLK